MKGRTNKSTTFEEIKIGLIAIYKDKCTKKHLTAKIDDEKNYTLLRNDQLRT